ncbi:MAG: LptE family protein [Chlorobi bacterium]|nr:LptE family protein [Chlorobiota bacterium]
MMNHTGKARGKRGSSPWAALALCLLLAGCYSFRGGAPPANLKTVIIPTVEDASGFGRATVRDEMTRELIRKFREDNSLRVVDAAQADSRLEVTITNIRNDERRNISTGEIETVRGVTISAQVTFLDNLKRTSVFANRAFSGDAQYRLDEGAAGEERAIRTAVDKITSEILLAAVADW